MEQILTFKSLLLLTREFKKEIVEVPPLEQCLFILILFTTIVIRLKDGVFPLSRMTTNN